MDTLHLVWSAPLLLVLGAAALDRLRWPLSAALVLAACALVWPTLAGRLATLSEPKARLADIAATTQTVTDVRGVITEIDQRTAPDEPIFVYPTSPLLYVLAGRSNATRFDHLNPGAATPSEIQQTIAALGNVRLVVISDFWRRVWGPAGANAPLESYVDAHFAEVARYGAYRVLMARL
jgi:hypothetical protein